MLIVVSDVHLLIGAIVGVCLARALYHLRQIEYSKADETHLVFECLRIHPTSGFDSPNPMRILYFAMGRWTIWAQRKIHKVLGAKKPPMPYAGLALLSAVFGCVACVTWAPLGWQTVLCVGASPLLLGLGRRALGDVPLVGMQCLTILAVHISPWAGIGLVVATMLVKESTFSALPAMALWSWFAGDAWWPYLVGLAVWAASSPKHFKWLRPRNIRTVESAYPKRFCHGGPLRLFSDLTLVSPAVVALVFWTRDPRLLAVGAMLVMYGSPLLHQQIRTMVLADVLLRVIVAGHEWWWVTIPIDALGFWRVWYRGKVYDPTHADLSGSQGMG
jgi:hypothetical protein